MSRVIIRKANYNYETLRPLFFEIMETIDNDRIKKGSSILIKPNLLSPAFPRQAVLTHFTLVRAAVEYVLLKGARAQISDSPAIGSFEKILRDGGIRDALVGLNVEVRPFKNSLKTNIGTPFESIDLAEDAVNADVIINLPKLKTHGQMLLTLGVKNLFGCVVGFRKPQWHMRTGINREMFARLLVQIYQRIRPAFTILDGILAMEGEGPGTRGSPKELGLLMGSDDALALDMTVCKMLGLSPDRIPTNKVARQMGLIKETIEIDGTLPPVKDFSLPDLSTLVYGPPVMHSFLRKYLLQRPVSDDLLCKFCGECWKICPAGAISHQEKKLQFDYDQCIRCYCCIEICPYGALHAVETIAGRIFRRIASHQPK